MSRDIAYRTAGAGARGGSFFSGLKSFSKGLAKLPVNVGIGGLAGLSQGIDGLGKRRRKTTRTRGRGKATKAKKAASTFVKNAASTAKKDRLLSRTLAEQSPLLGEIAKVIGFGVMAGKKGKRVKSSRRRLGAGKKGPVKF